MCRALSSTAGCVQKESALDLSARRVLTLPVDAGMMMLLVKPAMPNDEARSKVDIPAKYSAVRFCLRGRV